MFGKKDAGTARPNAPFLREAAHSPAQPPSGLTSATPPNQEWDEGFRDIKRRAFTRLVDMMDPAIVLRMSIDQGRAHIGRLLNEIVISERIQISAKEERRLLNELADDMLGFGPLERFLTDDNVSDVMVNGTDPIYVEIDGLMERTQVRFDSNAQLLNVCQRIVSLVGRRVDEASPICDARLQDGSRVNVIIPPLALNGPVLTIRRFRSNRLTLEQMARNGSISAQGVELLRIIARTRCNVLIVGGTGSGKTTLLNVITAYIEDDQRIITCEDTAELQLQQPHVVRLETRPPNIEGKGEVTMHDLVRNCLRMRPDRIIVGEVRGPEAFDLLQAMNTGHDGSMGTVHANSPAEAITRMTSLVTMGFPSLQPSVIYEMMSTSIDVIIQVDRMRDGSRKITQISEFVMQRDGSLGLRDILLYELGDQQSGQQNAVVGQHRFVHSPVGQLKQRAEYYGEGEALSALMRKDGPVLE